MPVELPSRSTDDLIERITGFCRLLRDRGLQVTPSESIDAVRVLPLLDLADRTDLYLALRVLLTTRRDDLPVFDALFAQWWHAENGARGQADANRASRQPSLPNARVQHQEGATIALTRWANAGDAMDDGSSPGLSAPSPNESRARKD